MHATNREDGVASFKRDLMALLPLFAPDSKATELELSPPEQPDDARWCGYLDRVEGSMAHGWCYDAHHPTASVTIEAVGSNGRRLLAVADLFRQDVYEAGFGTGHHGFCIDLTDLDPRNCQITLRFHDSKVPITKEPIALDAQLALLEEAMPDEYFNLLGKLATELRSKHSEMQSKLEGAALPDFLRDPDRRSALR